MIHFKKLCVPDVAKNINVKAFNLISRTIETRYTKWHETCKGECRLDATVCNNKQLWNNDKYRFECQELIDKGKCDKEFIWNPSNVNVINHVMLENNWIIKIVNVKKDYLIS